MDPPQIDTVLVGLDATPDALTAAELAVAIAGRYDADLVGLFVHDEQEVAAVESGAISPEEISDVARGVLDDIATVAEAAGVTFRPATAYGFSTRRKLVHPGSVVLDAADEFAADFIVLPREPVGGTAPQTGTLVKAAEYALLYASRPILAV